MALVKLHKCGYNTGTYPKSDPIWINPDFVIAAWGDKRLLHGAPHDYTMLRMHGDTSHQDWTLIWECIDDVTIAFAQAGSRSASEAKDSA